MALIRPRTIYPTPTSLPRNRKSTRVPVPPPVGGWNTRDDPVSMAGTDATELINFYPDRDKVAVRKGHTLHSSVEGNTGVQTDTTNYLDGGDIAAFDFGASQDWSVEFWAQHSGGSSPANRTIVGKKTFAGQGWEVYVQESTGNIYLSLDDGSTSNSFIVSGGLPNDATWYHFAYTVDRSADELGIYIDAVEVSGSPFDISALTGAFDAGTTAFRVFDNANNGQHWDNGLIDEVRVWDDVRTANEISTNYLSELTGSEANLIGYWKMNGIDGASVTTVTDDSPNSNTLTDTGAGDIEYVSFVNSVDVAVNIDTVAEFDAGSTQKLIAASPTNVYDATSTPASSLGSSFTNGQWQTAMMNGVMGLVNGADAPQDFDGTTLGSMTVSGTTVTELVGIHVFKARSYFWKANSPSFWYSATNTLGGAITEFALGEVSLRGGNLLFMADWTVDGGSGPDDYAVFVLDSGEVIVYQGDDPGTAANWALVGRYQIPTPMGRRAWAKVGGEVAVLTDQDIVFLPSAFNRESPPESKLVNAIKTAAPAYRSNFGWDVVTFNGKLLMNIPVSATSQEQYVINLETGAPTRYTGMTARCWAEFNDGLYFGGTEGIVFEGDTGSDDNGEQINASAKQAWGDLGVASNKRVVAARGVWSALSGFDPPISIAYDFTNENPAREVKTGGSGTAWGSAWGSAWSSSLTITGEWNMTDGVGQVKSIQLVTGTNGNTPEWYRTDLLVTEAPNI